MCVSSFKAGSVCVVIRTKLRQILNLTRTKRKKDKWTKSKLCGNLSINVCVCVVPVFPAARLPWRLASLWILKHVHEDGLKLAEDHRGNLEVALQPLYAQPEVLRQVGHVDPLPHLREELDQTGRTGRGVLAATHRNRDLEKPASNCEALTTIDIFTQNGEKTLTATFLLRKLSQ